MSHGVVAARARMLWMAEGRPDNRALDHWLMAEALIRAEHQQRYGELPDEPPEAVSTT